MSMGGRRLAFSAGSLLAAVAGVAFIGLASAGPLAGVPHELDR